MSVAFSVAPSVGRFASTGRQIRLRADGLTLFFSPTVINTAHRRALGQTMWSGTVASGATLEVEEELAVGSTS